MASHPILTSQRSCAIQALRRSVFAIICRGLMLLGPLLHCASAEANESPPAPASAPVWATVEAASSYATAHDAVHSLVTSVVRQRQLNPLRAARLFAAVRVAQAEALHQPDAHSDSQLVLTWAASNALSWVLPQDNSARWAALALLETARSGVGVSAHTEALVHAAVWPVLGHVIDDGADARRRPLAKPDPLPGTWLRTPPLFAEQPVEPQGGSWRAWCPDADGLQVAPAVRHGSLIWQQELKQVAMVNAGLTAEQKSIAQRWHLDAGSITPPGVWNAIAAAFLHQSPQPHALHHRVLAVLNMAMQDALVAAWRIKLTYWSERPITAIRRELDPAFEPLLVTPPFPGYVSGHAAVSAAAAGVLSHYFPEHRGRWHALAQEAAASRLYGGIHFASDNEQGLVLGQQVADVCIKAFGAALPGAGLPRLVSAPAGMSPDFFVFPRMRGGPE